MTRLLVCAAALFLIAASPSPGRPPAPAAAALRAGAIPASDAPGAWDASALLRYPEWPSLHPPSPYQR